MAMRLPAAAIPKLQDGLRSGNRLHSRQHKLTMSGYNWLRINMTKSDGSTQNLTQTLVRISMMSVREQPMIGYFMEILLLQILCILH